MLPKPVFVPAPFAPLVLAATGLLAAALVATPAHASPIAYGSGLSNPALVIDFSGLSDGTAVTTQYAGQGVTFTGLTITSQFGSTLGSTTAPAAANFANGQPINATFTISFSSIRTAADFFLDTDGYGTTITSTLNGRPVESVSAGSYASNGADYFGFTNSAFDGLTVAVGGTGTAVIDNLELGGTAVQTVPEPASPGMLVAGLAGLLALGARRRA